MELSPVELPLIERAQSGDTSFRLTTATDPAANPAEGLLASLCGLGADVALPPLPGPGEQYRFHFDMTKCIGCKCCVVACNEQNGNPADILWRRVGEIEGGVYPDTQRHYLSMGCNHCLEPTCMTGCPVDAYSKDNITGIVRHSADACIGCQYCTWNCSYGVPQFNPARGVVGKCDMCYGRLTQSQLPACVSACPEGAIRIETVRTDEWRSEYRASANSPGMPSADDSLSTTRITLPSRISGDARKVDLNRLRPEQPHTPLVLMTVLTQLSVGAFTSIFVLQLFSPRLHRAAALAALLTAAVALSASTFHLGRPIYAWRALKMWRRSWLSREVLLFSLFEVVATTYSVMLLLGLRGAVLLGALTTLCGIAGILASARLYLVPGRPAWNSPFTFVEFFLTAALFGALSASTLRGATPLTQSLFTLVAMLVFVAGAAKLFWLYRSEAHELRGAAILLLTVLSTPLFTRYALLASALIALPFAHGPLALLGITTLVLAGELLSRWLFFVSVVPTNIAMQYLAPEAA